MKNTTIFMLTISLLVIITLLTLSQKEKKANTAITIIDKKFKLQVADNDSERQRGLSLIDNLPPDEGMLFIFDDKNIREFWMRNTLIPLQIIFIDKCTIVDVREMTVEKDLKNPQKTYKSRLPADKAIELNSQTVNKNMVGRQIDELCNF
jgi:hypothetical protein